MQVPKHRILLFMSLLLTLAMVLAACPSSGSQSTTESAPATGGGEAASTSEAQGETVTLTIATVNNPDMKVMESLSDRFESAHPNIKLEWVVLPENELRARVTTDTATGAASFDVVTVGTFEVPIWGANGWIHSIDDLMSQYPDQVQPNYDLDDLLPAVREGLSNEGTLYALPFYAESSFTMYNKAMFDEAGLEMPEQPTWEQIREFACAIHDPDNGGAVESPGTVWRKYHGRNSAALTLVETIGAFLPGFTRMEVTTRTSLTSQAQWRWPAVGNTCPAGTR
ncbi:MAG: hypothetical protein KatS3mg050_3480 [Litorilinea sp.]|nr:MAG: hypothetical protein KatS3mg050_3480 [Litorilinea sp.]